MKALRCAALFFILAACGMPSVSAAEDASSALSVIVCNPSGQYGDGSYVDAVLAGSADVLSRKNDPNIPPLLNSFPQQNEESVQVSSAWTADAEISELFRRRGWTDGLPVVPPTRERVDAMLAGTKLLPFEEVAALDPCGGMATVEKIAVNAVMAGCRPSDMPIVIAAVKAAADPVFDLRGLSTTTSPDAPLMIISGPIVKKLGLNAGSGSMGRGVNSNARLGRALSLVIHNVGGSRPGMTDMSALGSPCEFGMVLVENKDITPWTGIWEDLGIPETESAVTLVGAEGERGVIGTGDSRHVLDLIGAHLHGLAFQRPIWGTVVLALASDTCSMLARDGYGKEDIKREILLRNPMKTSEFSAWFGSDKRNMPDMNEVLGHARDGIVQTPFVRSLIIVCCGGMGAMKNKIFPGWLFSARPVTQIIGD